MKKQNMQKAPVVSVRHTWYQKVIGIIALAGLFACGVMVGLGIHTSNNNAVVAADGDEGLPTCQVIENMLQSTLLAEEDLNPTAHQYNIEVYKKLEAVGCPENVEKYHKLIQREQEILLALTGNIASDNNKTCSEIESLLLQRLPTGNLQISEIRIDRAKIYANLAERGCPENSQHYVTLAAKELEIARALEDDKFNEIETVEVVETYKRLEMKQAANDVLNKVQKLTDPAIDFILQVQKIIEE